MLLEITKLDNTPGNIGNGKYLTNGNLFDPGEFIQGKETGMAINFPQLGETENSSWRYLKGQDKVCLTVISWFYNQETVIAGLPVREIL